MLGHAAARRPPPSAPSTPGCRGRPARTSRCAAACRPSRTATARSRPATPPPRPSRWPTPRMRVGKISAVRIVLGPQKPRKPMLHGQAVDPQQQVALGVDPGGEEHRAFQQHDDEGGRRPNRSAIQPATPAGRGIRPAPTRCRTCCMSRSTSRFSVARYSGIQPPTVPKMMVLQQATNSATSVSRQHVAAGRPGGCRSCRP